MSFTSSAGSATFATSTDILTAIGQTGTTLDLGGQPFRNFAIQVKYITGVPSSTVVLEGSLDGINFSTILNHTIPGVGDGGVLWSGVFNAPAFYIRSRITLISPASSITVTVVGTN